MPFGNFSWRGRIRGLIKWAQYCLCFLGSDEEGVNGMHFVPKVDQSLGVLRSSRLVL